MLPRFSPGCRLLRSAMRQYAVVHRTHGVLLSLQFLRFACCVLPLRIHVFCHLGECRLCVLEYSYILCELCVPLTFITTPLRSGCLSRPHQLRTCVQLGRESGMTASSRAELVHQSMCLKEGRLVEIHVWITRVFISALPHCCLARLDVCLHALAGESVEVMRHTAQSSTSWK